MIAKKKKFKQLKGRRIIEKNFELTEGQRMMSFAFLFSQEKDSRADMMDYIARHLPFLYKLYDPQEDKLYKYIMPVYNIFLFFKACFWSIIRKLPSGIFEMFFSDVFQIVSFLIFQISRRYLFMGALKGLDFRVYSFRQKNKFTTGFRFYLHSLTWPREKWYFLLRKLHWRERVFKFFLSGPYGWLGFFYNFFWVRFLSVSGYWLLKLSVSVYLLMPSVSREEGVLWNIHKMNVLEKRFKDPSLFPGYKIDMSIFFSLYLLLAVFIMIMVELQ